jgi:transcriptional regulator with XRE-family HTH domain
VQNREVKLGQMLYKLIEDRGYSRNRRKILRALDVSPAALSQYVRDQTRPSFNRLLALADFFDVSLDYLVYGQPARGGGAADDEPALRFVDLALSEVQARTSRHSAIVARIGRVLADRIDQVAADLIAAPAAAREGLVQDDEMVRLEGYCLRADILSLDLGFDVIQVEGGVAAGRFLTVVARNLKAGSRYRFLIPGPEHVPDSLVSAFRSLLTQQVGGDQVHENCAFRRTGTPVMLGIVLYQLDVAVLETKEPALHAQFSSDTDENHWLGCVIRPNADSNSDMLLDPRHLRHAQSTFEALWASGQAL